MHTRPKRAEPSAFLEQPPPSVKHGIVHNNAEPGKFLFAFFAGQKVLQVFSVKAEGIATRGSS